MLVNFDFRQRTTTYHFSLVAGTAEFFSKIRKTARSRDLFNRLRRGKKEHVGTRIGYLLAKFQLK